MSGTESMSGSPPRVAWWERCSVELSEAISEMAALGREAVVESAARRRLTAVASTTVASICDL